MEMLSDSDAARMIGVPVGTLCGWVGRRQVPHVRRGPRLVRFRRAEPGAWIAQKHVPALEGTGGRGAGVKRPPPLALYDGEVRAPVPPAGRDPVDRRR